MCGGLRQWAGTVPGQSPLPKTVTESSPGPRPASPLASARHHPSPWGEPRPGGRHCLPPPSHTPPWLAGTQVRRRCALTQRGFRNLSSGTNTMRRRLSSGGFWERPPAEVPSPPTDCTGSLAALGPGHSQPRHPPDPAQPSRGACRSAERRSRAPESKGSSSG